MLQKQDTTANLSFFGYKRNSAVHSKLIPTHVGGKGDCGYRSAAVAMISNILSIKTRANQELAQKLLKLHATYFDQPQIPTTSRLVTPAEQIAKQFANLLEHPVNRAKFIIELAYALRQEAVNEICAHPEHYRGSFIADDKEEPISPAEMRLQSTWIDATAIAALSRVLHVPIEVQVVEHHKEIPMSLDCTDSQQNLVASPIVMQLQGKHYVPKLSNPEYFIAINEHDAVTLTPKVVFEQDPELNDLLAKIAAKDQDMLEQFDNTKTRLNAMVKANELTKEDLINIYIEGLGTSDYLRGRPKQVALEHGNEDFFKEIVAARNPKFNPLTMPPQAGHDARIIHELVHAIARAVSIGQMDESIIYERDAKSGPSM